jgi:AraC family transcriptional activator of pobA
MMKREKPAPRFKIAAIGEGKCSLASFNRRDFYKISFVTRGAPTRLRYGSLEEVEVMEPALVFINPIVPYAWSGNRVEASAEGWFCVFNDAFIRSSADLSGAADRLFATQALPVYFPDKIRERYLGELFARMRREVEDDYAFSESFYRNHLQLIFHEAMQMRSKENIEKTGMPRIAGEFIRLLNLQFPVDLPLQPIEMTKAADFADRIAVHVNHLNAAVRKATGKSTTAHIGERLATEAQSLLRHTDYSIAEIGFGLGFEYQTYFNRFFKKHCGVTPSEYRRVGVAG